MMAAFNSATLPPKSIFTAKPKSPKTSTTASFLTILIPTKSANLISTRIKCNSSSSERNDQTGNLKDVLSGMVDQRVEELLNKQENKDLLDGLEKASQRVEMAKRELAEFQRQETEAKLLKDYINLLEARSSEIAECQKDISDARAMIEEAERSLNISSPGGRGALNNAEGESINKNEEKLESVKAALISAIIGVLAGLPISLTRVTSSSELILPVAITVVSCALFGVTFRYAVRRDLDDFHLKSGTSAAFGVVKGLATLGAGPPLEMDTSSFLSHAFDGAVYERDTKGRSIRRKKT